MASLYHQSALQITDYSGLDSRLFWNLILVPAAVLVLAEFAIGRWQAVIYAVRNWWHRPQIGKHRLQVVVGQISKFSERHDRVQLPCTHDSSPHRFSKSSFVVIANP